MEDSVEIPKMCGESLHVGVKGKRAKRRRTHRLPLSAVITVPSTSSSEFSDSMAEEEEDMANCLILLAQGEILGISHHNGGGGGGKVNGHKLPETATTAGDDVKFGSYTYKCRTCNKSFPSFQALGGHRTSHKRPRIAAVAVMERKKVAEEDNPKLTFSNSNYKTTGASFFSATTTMTVETAPAMSRVHECSICGSEFSSGQALGGHMRRHRTAMDVPAFSFSSQAEEKREKSLFDLDLNLPAPSDDEPESPSGVTTNFVFARKESMIFPSLVDCHY